MEGYDDADYSCVTAVLTFLDAWDRQLVASGYVSGVYSSAASGVTDLQTTPPSPAIRWPSCRRSGSRCGTTSPT
jgi:Rv2525c-like, glycoside hydrolase-like domain